jgi:hypothetical protein
MDDKSAGSLECADSGDGELELEVVPPPHQTAAQDTDQVKQKRPPAVKDDCRKRSNAE